VQREVTAAFCRDNSIAKCLQVWCCHRYAVERVDVDTYNVEKQLCKIAAYLFFNSASNPVKTRHHFMYC